MPPIIVAFDEASHGTAAKAPRFQDSEEIYIVGRKAVVQAARSTAVRFALDRATVRRTDHDGRLHVDTTNISKANVCPYLGREIPGCAELGLDPDKVYQLYRHPDELAKAASTFNNVPLLSRHVEVTADDHKPDHVCGSTGTDAEFDGTYLKNSLVIWAKDMIQAVENEEQKELSSAYRYRADMTPGVVDGTRYDGVMRDIIGNHVALVKEGRAGADVVVGDSTEELNMKLSRKALLAQGALTAYLIPKLAQDSKVNIMPALKGVTQENFKEQKPTIFAELKKVTDGKLAKDADIGDVVELLDQLEKIDAPDVIEAATGAEVSADPVDDDASEADTYLKSVLSDEQWSEYQSKKGGAAPVGDAEETEEEKKKRLGKDKVPENGVTKAAMDAAVRASSEAATKAATKIQQDIRSAEREVRPYVGELTTAFDSAEQVYRTALEMLKVEGVADIHVSALPTILKMQPVPGARKTPTPSLAADAAGVKGFNERYPGAARIGQV